MYVAVYLSAISFILWSPHPAASLNTKLNATDTKHLISSMNSLTGAVLGLQNQLNAKQPGPADCTDVRKFGNTKSGVYRIWPVKWEFYGSFLVFCDMEKYGGAWTVIQRRGNYKQPEDYFYRTWKEYQMGFGKLREDFWLGNDRIFLLTNQGNYSLRIDMKDKEGNKRFAFYREFWIENEKQLYRLHLSGFNGNAGDSFSGVNGMPFSTKDKDNDIGNENCAKWFKGAWWYNKCHNANLNGLYLNGIHESYADGIEWKTWKGLHYSLSEVEMKIRRIQVKSNIKSP